MNGSQPADIFISAVVICLVVGFLLLVSYILMARESGTEIVGIAG
jgi:hypothetical protein